MKPVRIWEKKEFCSLITWRTSLATGVSTKRKKSMREKQENLVWAVQNQDFRGRAHLIYPRLVDDVFGIGCISQCAHGLTVASVCRRHGWGRSIKLKHTPCPSHPAHDHWSCCYRPGWIRPLMKWAAVVLTLRQSTSPNTEPNPQPTHWQPWWFWSCLRGCPSAARSILSPGMGCMTASGRVPPHCWSRKES